MPIEIRDILKANLVLVDIHLLENPEELSAFGNLVGTEVQLTGSGLIVGAPSNVVGTGRTFSLSKDRITLDLSPLRSVIEREYPSNEPPEANKDLERLAEVSHLAIANTRIEGITVRTFGYNVEFLCEQDKDESASRYLAHRLFNPNFSANQDWEFLGGASRLTFQHQARQWNIKIEPRFNDQKTNNIFVSVNLHVVNSDLPSLSEIRASLGEVWVKTQDFLNMLELSA